MSKFFTKKKIAIIAIAAIITVIVAVLVGVNISSSKKAKERLAEKAKVERTIEEKKKVVKELDDVKNQKEKTEEELEETRYTEEYKEYQKLSDEEKEKQEVIPRKTIVDYSELEDIKEDQEEDLGKEVEEDSLPSKFDLRDKINIKIEDQDTRGLCWDFASLTSLETNLALTKGLEYDFSEIYVDYITSQYMSDSSLSRKRPGYGGNFVNFTEYAALNNGFVLQDQYEYRNYEYYEYETFYTAPTVDINVTKTVTFPSYKKEYFDEDKQEEEFKNFQSVIKTHIMNYGSVWAGIQMISNESNLYMYDIEEAMFFSDGGHAISIIGWDDSYSKDNFTSPTGQKPEHDGAYIVANSWGEYWGYNGYFYISYEDYFVNSDMYGVISTDIKDLFDISTIKNKPIREYVETNYADQIIERNGKKYIAKYNLSGKYKVDLSNCGLTSLEDIEIFDGAIVIDLSGNELTDVEGLENILHPGYVYGKDGYLSEYTVDLSNNKIGDISNLEGKNIGNLILTGNKGIKGYSLLNECNSLVLDDCDLTELEDITKLKGLIRLSVENNSFENLDVLDNFERIYELDLSGNNIEDLNRIGFLFDGSKEIHILDLSDNNLTDISLLKNISPYAIDLSNNPNITDYSPLKTMSGITYIGLRGCNIEDASIIKVDREMDQYVNEFGRDVSIRILTSEGIDIVSDDAFDYYYITYDLSNNSGIRNLDILSNAGTLLLKNCDVEDISELNNLEYLMYVDLSGNKNLNGTYTGSSLRKLILRDCNIDNNFDFFNAQNINNLDIRDNEIDIDTVRSKYPYARIIVNKFEINRDKEYEEKDAASIDADEVKVRVPIVSNINTEFNTNTFNVPQLLSSTEDMYVNGEMANSNIYNIIPVTTETKITGKSTYGGIVEVEFYLDEDIENEWISIKKAPDRNRYESMDDEIDTTGMIVVDTYPSGVYTETSEYSIGKASAVDFGRAKVKVNKGDCDTYIGIYVDGVVPNYDEENDDMLDEDLIYPEDYEEEFPTLTFNSEELYYIAKDYWDGMYVNADDDLLTITLTESRERNDSGIPMYIPRRLLYDVRGLKPMIVTDIYILFDEENGDEFISSEELDILEEFDDLWYLHIITPEEEDLSQIIADSDRYIMTIEHGVG